MPERTWERLEDLFAQACELKPSSRTAFVIRRCGGDAELREEVLALLHAHDTAAGFLETSPSLIENEEGDAFALAPENRVGAWRIVRPIGRGGMGDVYEALRADGAFEQRAALKLMRGEAAAHVERFHAERNILARLDHYGIARLLDGGVTTDGRPWAVMEYVEGLPITAWCRIREASLAARLRLFAQVCDAVGYAHRNLIVHRDLKPSNILVDERGRARLLDFGIAKLLDPSAGVASPEATQVPLTPDYCAPEQLAGEAITTATDVYALGLLLYELVTDAKPHSVRGLPLARAVRTLIDEPVGNPSAAAAANSAAPAPARLLRGDIDAIVARCLRREPAHRYATVDALRLDVERHLEGAPVSARGGAKLYVLGRFVRRHRWAVAGALALLLALGAGVSGITWQARRAEAQAARAEAAKNFLLGMFKASDPRKASDKPRGGTTARELLDASSARIEKDFAGQPELQIELLGVAAEIYAELGENERHRALRRQQAGHARQYYGELHPAMIDGYLFDADLAVRRDDFAEALRLLDTADPLIRRAGFDGSARRAYWWLIRGKALFTDWKRQDDAEAALSRAVELYARVAPTDHNYLFALNNLGLFYGGPRGDFERYRDYLLRARKVVERVSERNESDLAIIEHNLAWSAAALGDYAAAEAGYERAAALYRRTYGEHDSHYWNTLAFWAAARCDGGDRIGAQRLYDALLPLVPVEAKEGEAQYVAAVHEMYGACLGRTGRPVDAIAHLEIARRLYGQMDRLPLKLARVGEELGDAYARAGRTDDARRALRSALDLRAARLPADNVRVLQVRVRWAEFLRDQGETADAEEQFHETIEEDHERHLATTALAWTGLAQLALRRGDAKSALQMSTRALQVYSRVSGLRYARMEPTLWRAHAQALARTGDLTGAADYGRRALDAFTRYDDPASADIAESAAVLAEIAGLTKK